VSEYEEGRVVSGSVEGNAKFILEKIQAYL